LHIWGRKEIENYLIVPTAIQRVIAAGVRRGVKPPDSAAVVQRIDELIESVKEQTIDQIANEYLLRNKGGGVHSANPKARSVVNDAWRTFDGRASIVSGKWLMSQLSDWAKNEFGVSFSREAIARELRQGEIVQEVEAVVGAIEKHTHFASA
jgi:hypothetical protein